MDKRFEKLLAILMIIATICLLIIFTAEKDVVSADSSYISSSGIINEHPGILRFHVVANSNSDEDQKLKLKVRDYVLERVQKALADEIMSSGEKINYDSDIELATCQSKLIKSFIFSNLSQIETWADEAVAKYGYEYKTTAGIGIRHIPAKYYDDLFFPEGNYEALTISIGEGQGENWWCVVFPPLCLVETDEPVYNQDNNQEILDDINVSDLQELNASKEEQIILKSKTLELLKNSDLTDESVSNEACMNSILKSLKCLFN